MTKHTTSDIPIDSLHAILVHLELEQRAYEDAKDPRQHDHFYGHVAKVREWLSSIDKRGPGIKINIV